MKKSTVQSKKPKLHKSEPALRASIPQRIKVKLDYKTTIIIHRLSSLKIWKKRYPDAQVVN
jgi:hypothetical protein